LVLHTYYWLSDIEIYIQPYLPFIAADKQRNKEMCHRLIKA